MPLPPPLNKGKLILLSPNAKDASPASPGNSYFVFQFNPEKLQHTFGQTQDTISNSTTETQDESAEFFYLAFDLDSANFEQSSKNQSPNGLHPSLAMLELMMQPQIVGNQTFAPTVVFSWGPKRTVPVRLISVTIEEKSFDGILNPNQASVTLVMRVLTAAEVNNNPGARGLCLSHQNSRLSLAEEYKGQTGQSPSLRVGASFGNQASAATGVAGDTKTKVKA